MNIDVIHNADCKEMSAVPNDSVGLIVSGPPYWTYVDYTVDSLNAAPDTSASRPSSNTYENFLRDLAACYAECFRVLRPGRYCVVNVGTFVMNGRCYPFPYHIVSILEEAGFVFAHDIIWHKVAAGRRHARIAVQYPYPGYFTPNNRTEFLLVFQKHPGSPFGRSIERRRSQGDRIALDNVFFQETANNVWHIPPKPSLYHPCPFPPEIPLRLITLYSKRHDIVLDPFMGIGTTARAARMLGRHFVGYEKESRFIKTALSALDEPLAPRPAIAANYTRVLLKRRRQPPKPYLNPFDNDR